MSQATPHETGSTMLHAGSLDAAHLPDDDLALGCECADPALQIERWHELAALSAGELS